MNYRVMVVEDNELPSFVDWVIARTCEGFSLFIKRSRSTFETGLAEIMMAVWKANDRLRAGLRA